LHPDGRNCANTALAGHVSEIFYAANRFEFRGKMRHARQRVNIFKKTLNHAAGSPHQYTSR
jgi:hypothetical protein